MPSNDEPLLAKYLDIMTLADRVIIHLLGCGFCASRDPAECPKGGATYREWRAWAEVVRNETQKRRTA